jgi:hypothetical protein
MRTRRLQLTPREAHQNLVAAILTVLPLSLLLVGSTALSLVAATIESEPLRTYQDANHSIEFSPDDQLIAAAYAHIGGEGGADLIEVETGVVLGRFFRELPNFVPVHQVAFSPTEDTLFTWGFDDTWTVHEWNIAAVRPPPNLVLNLIGAHDTSGYATDVAVVGNFAYVADGEAGLQVIDGSDSANPVWRGGLVIEEEAVGVAVMDTSAFVASRSVGLHVIDIMDPASPRLLGQLAIGSDIRDMAVSGPHAFMVDHESGLHVIDISEPTLPRRIGGYEVLGASA